MMDYSLVRRISEGLSLPYFRHNRSFYLLTHCSKVEIGSAPITGVSDVPLHRPLNQLFVNISRDTCLFNAFELDYN